MWKTLNPNKISKTHFLAIVVLMVYSIITDKSLIPLKTNYEDPKDLHSLILNFRTI